MKVDFNNYKYMYSNLWKWNKFSYFLSIIRAFLLVALPLCMALIPKIIVDMVSLRASLKQFIFSIVLLSFLICMISWIEPYIKEKLSSTTENSRMKYRIAAFEKLLKVEYKELESNELQQKYEKAKMFIYAGKYTPLLDFLDINVLLLSSFLGIFFYTLVIMSINPFIFLFILTVCIVEYFLSLSLKKFEFEIVGKQIPIYTKFDYLNRIAVDDKYSKDIRLFSAQKYFIDVIEKLLDKHKKMMTFITKKTIKYTAIEVFLSVIRDIVIYILLILAVNKNKIEVSDFIFLFGITTGFTGWISSATKQMLNFYEINKQCGYFRDFINLQSDNTSNYTGIVLEKISKIEFKDVCFAYNNNNILNNVNFVINTNESVALVGCNGAGKTTIIKLLCGFYKPHKGEIYINDININKIQRESLLRLISAIFQDYSFFPMSIQSNIAMKDSYYIDDKRLIEVSKKAGIYDKIYQLDEKFNTKMIKQVYNDAIDFSGGEKQKLLLVRALYKNSDLLILDEPTSALDPIAESKIYEQYKDIMQNRISIFISHRLASTQFCDKIIFLNKGVISETGTHFELLQKKGDYWKMFESQRCYYHKEGAQNEKQYIF